MPVSLKNIEPSLQRMNRWWKGKGLVLGSAVPFYRTAEKEPPMDSKTGMESMETSMESMGISMESMEISMESMETGMSSELSMGFDSTLSTKSRMNPEDVYADPEKGAAYLYRQTLRQYFPSDVLPFVDTDLGPGSLAVYLGCRPESSGDSVWFHSPYQSKEEIDAELYWNDENLWWKRTQKLLTGLKELSRETCIVPFPDLCENIDVLASLRGAENLMMDFIDDPKWVEEAVNRIDDIYNTAVSRFLPLIQRQDNSTAFHAFRLWGKGLTAKLQCDASAMISSEMFERFVLPSLQSQCRLLDNSLYHLDGTQSMQHLETLLQIDELKAIEWTPQAGIETGEHPRWYPMYQRILDAGKSVQILVGDLTHMKKMFEEIGSDGVYLLSILDYEDFQRLEDIAAPYYT